MQSILLVLFVCCQLLVADLNDLQIVTCETSSGYTEHIKLACNVFCYHI